MFDLAAPLLAAVAQLLPPKAQGEEVRLAFPVGVVHTSSWKVRMRQAAFLKRSRKRSNWTRRRERRSSKGARTKMLHLDGVLRHGART
jgi:hypothetical protein